MFVNGIYSYFFLGLVMISSLMIITSIAMLAFPKTLRGNRIPAPHQVDSIDAHKSVQTTKVEPQEEESIPQLKGIPSLHLFLALGERIFKQFFLSFCYP